MRARRSFSEDGPSESVDLHGTLVSCRVVRRPCLVVLLVLAAAQPCCAASLGEAHPCPEAACAQGSLCVVGRCRREDAPPAAADTLRSTLVPTDLAVIAARGGGGGGDTLPETVALGRAGSGAVVMLLRFAPSWREDAEVQSAFLVLHPIEGARPSSSPIAFEVARILEAWQPSLVSWGRQPRLDVPFAAGVVRARPSLPLRIDVSPLVRTWAHASGEHGIALLAGGDDAYGAVVSMGVGQGRGPRLEVYVK